MVSNHNPIETWDQPGKTKGAEQWLHEECERDRRINDRSTISCGHHVRRQVQAEVVLAKTKAKTESITTVASNAVAIDLLSLSLSSSPSFSPSPSSSPLLSASPSALSPTSDSASDSVSTLMSTKVEGPLECDNAKENESFIDTDTAAASMVHEEHDGNSSTVAAYADGVTVFQPATHRSAVMASIFRNSAIQALDSRLGTTTPSSSSSTGGEVLDEVLLTALSKRQERLFLLRLDRDYCNFIGNTSQEHLELPWLNSYFRMLIHRSANYFGLRREVDALHKRIRLFKTEHSMIPTLRFCDLVEHDEEGQHDPRPANLRNSSQDEAGVTAVDVSAEQEQQLQTQPQQAPAKPTPTKVLKRCPLPPRPVSACESRCGESFIGTTSRRTMVSMEQREKAYAEARARIFCEDEGGKGKKESSTEQGQMATCIGEEKEREEVVAEVLAIVAEGSGNHAVDEEVDRVEAEQVVTRLESSCDIVKPLPRRSSGMVNAGGAQGGLTRRISTSSTASSSSGTTMVDTSTKSDIMSPGGIQSPASTSSGSSRTGATADYFTRQHYQGVPSGAVHGGGNFPDQRSRQGTQYQPSLRHSGGYPTSLHQQQHQQQSFHHHQHPSHSYPHLNPHQHAHHCHSEPRFYCCPESYNHHCPCCHGSFKQGRGHNQVPDLRTGNVHCGHSGQPQPRGNHGSEVNRRLSCSAITGPHYTQYQQPTGYPQPHYYGSSHAPCSSQGPSRHERYHHPSQHYHPTPNYHPQPPQSHFPRCCDINHTESPHGHGGSHEAVQQQQQQQQQQQRHPLPTQNTHQQQYHLQQQQGMMMMERFEREDQVEGPISILPRASPPSGRLPQVHVRPFPSSNGYRPNRQEISVPQHLPQQQQQQQPKQQPRVQPQHRSTRPPSSMSTVHHPSSQQLQQLQLQQESINDSSKGQPHQTWRQQRVPMTSGRDDKSSQVVHDVDRRPPKSTELYDPYASKSASRTRNRSQSLQQP